eukprot:766515-Hanusia_phi.AAC.6
MQMFSPSARSTKGWGISVQISYIQENISARGDPESLAADNKVAFPSINLLNQRNQRIPRQDPASNNRVSPTTIDTKKRNRREQDTDIRTQKENSAYKAQQILTILAEDLEIAEDRGGKVGVGRDGLGLDGDAHGIVLSSDLGAGVLGAGAEAATLVVDLDLETSD